MIDIILLQPLAIPMPHTNIRMRAHLLLASRGLIPVAAIARRVSLALALHVSYYTTPSCRIPGTFTRILPL